MSSILRSSGRKEKPMSGGSARPRSSTPDSNDEDDNLVDIGGAPVPANASSRSSVRHVWQIISKFSEFKRVDDESCSIVIDDNRRLHFFAEDVASVWGIPCGDRDIREDAVVSPEMLCFAFLCCCTLLVSAMEQYADVFASFG